MAFEFTHEAPHWTNYDFGYAKPVFIGILINKIRVLECG
jgi:hypothetical protein